MKDILMTLFRLIMLLAIIVTAQGCVSAVTKTTGAVVSAAKTTAKAGGAVVGAAVDTVTTDDNDENDSASDENHHDDDPRPFSAKRNATQEVNAALAAAQYSNKNVLLVLGGNWCHDSRGLAGKFQRPELARVIADGYELVWVDVGYRDRNLHIAERFGVDEVRGTPTVLIVSPEGYLLNGADVHNWNTAASKPYDETLAYFRLYSGKASR